MTEYWGSFFCLWYISDLSKKLPRLPKLPKHDVGWQGQFQASAVWRCNCYLRHSSSTLHCTESVWLCCIPSCQIVIYWLLEILSAMSWIRSISLMSLCGILRSSCADRAVCFLLQYKGLWLCFELRGQHDHLPGPRCTRNDHNYWFAAESKEALTKPQACEQRCFQAAIFQQGWQSSVAMLMHQVIQPRLRHKLFLCCFSLHMRASGCIPALLDWLDARNAEGL